MDFNYKPLDWAAEGVGRRLLILTINGGPTT